VVWRSYFHLSSLHLEHGSAQPAPGPPGGSTGQDRKRRWVVGCYLPSHGTATLISSLPLRAPPCALTSRPRHHCRSGWFLVPAAKFKSWAVCSLGARLVSACHVGARTLCVRAPGVRSLYCSHNSTSHVGASHNSTSDRIRIGRACTCGIGARVRLMPISMRAAGCAHRCFSLRRDEAAHPVGCNTTCAGRWRLKELHCAWRCRGGHS